MKEEELLSLLDETNLKNRLIQIRTIYEKLEQKQKEFCKVFNVHCKDGCGECCEHFVPDVSLLEAEYLAYGLIVDGIDEDVLKLLENYVEGSPFCPLYDFSKPHCHCSIYKWRPLICRLFGASASKDKTGRPVFRQCKYNDDKTPITSEILESQKQSLVIMSDFGNELADDEIGDNSTKPMKEAVINAINLVRYMIELEEESNK